MQPLSPEDPPQAGAYRLLGRLGGGGMGTVYLGRNAGGRTVAVKLIRAEFAADSEFRRRFQLEVAAARRVSGRWTPPVLDADTEGRQPWVATAYVPGPDLAQALRQFGPLPADSIRTLGAGLAEALLAVHGLGLVHRDLKPSNVVLSLDGPRMIDFGIARALDGTGTALTQTGSVIGSPGYMSPEQAMGHAAGPASDVFSLGAVLAVAATGRPPFGEGPTGVAVMYRVLHEQHDLDNLPNDLRDIVEACLDKDPARRPTPQQIRAHLLPGPDDTIPQTGWLPPAISEAVARLATELLHLETPQPQTPPLPSPASPPTAHSSWHTAPATQFGPPFSAPTSAPVAGRRPRRRALAVIALLTAVVSAGAVSGVLASGSSGDRTGSASAANTPSTSAGSASSAPAAAGPSATTTSTPDEPQQSTSSPSANASAAIPIGMLGTWKHSGTSSTDPEVTVELSQGRPGGDVGRFGMRLFNSDEGCWATLHLTGVSADSLSVLGTKKLGSACGAGDMTKPFTIVLESATAIALRETIMRRQSTYGWRREMRRFTDSSRLLPTMIDDIFGRCSVQAVQRDRTGAGAGDR